MHFKNGKFLVGLVVSAGLLAAPLATVPAMAADTPPATGPSVVINEAYLSGGSAGAAFRNKFVELYNKGSNTKDSGLVDRDAWIKYLGAHNPVSPDFARRSVAVVNTTAAEVKSGDAMALAFSKLNLSSLGGPQNTSLKAVFTDAKGVATQLGTVGVASGAASVNVKVPAGAAAGTGTLLLTAVESGTVAKAAVKVAAPLPPKCTAPVMPSKWYDVLGWIKYAFAWLEYQKCLRG